MKVNVDPDGSATLNIAEVRLLALVLDLGLELAEQSGARDPDAAGGNVEVRLLNAIDLLGAMGISADGLHDIVDSRFRDV